MLGRRKRIKKRKREERKRIRKEGINHVWRDATLDYTDKEEAEAVNLS